MHDDGDRDGAEALGQLATLLDYGQILYAAYLDDGRSKGRARPIRDNNARIVELLLRSVHRLEAPLRTPALELLHHSEMFVNQWDAYDRNNDVDETGRFAYPTDVGFPSRAVALLRGAA